MNYIKKEKTKKFAYNLRMNLSELKNRSILLFGKSRAFSSDEFASQMKHHKIEIVKEYSEDIALVVEGRMMTPYEQNSSEMVYEEKEVEFVSIDSLESELAKMIDEDTLLMSLKLSHDKERLQSFLQNAMISNKLFFKLIKIFSWKNEDFFENDDNRDVSAAFILRFYENIERNHNVQFATTGIIHLVAQTKSSELLQEISQLQPLQFHPKIGAAIAMSIYATPKMQEKFFRGGDEKILEALSFNKNIITSLISKFLKDEALGSNVARSVNLNKEMFELLQEFQVSLALNESLSVEMQKHLMAQEKKDIYFALALNSALDEEILKELLGFKDAQINEAIYENAATPVELLEEAYTDEKNHMALSKNESTPIELLYQLQLDARYDRYVKSNAGYGKHIQTENIGWLV